MQGITRKFIHVLKASAVSAWPTSCNCLDPRLDSPRARVTSQAEEVFGDDAKAARWLRKPKIRFEGRFPLELLRTDAGSRIVEEMLLQIDHGFAA
jgi:hypothetical protein